MLGIEEAHFSIGDVLTMAIPCCYGGKLLSVDLTNGRLVEEILPEEVYRQFIGGNGLGIRVLYERMKSRVDPLGPENMLGFAAGVLTGTTAPGSGRHMVVTKSPLTGAWAESNSGGTLGPALKTAGYDLIVFSGVSPGPVYLSIEAGKPALMEASSIWGKDTYETQDLLREEMSNAEATIACIGPSGESRSLLAGIVTERGRIAARNGVGAVMGSKRLKAVVVGGAARTITTANPNSFSAAMQRFQTIIESNEYARALSEAGTGGSLGFLVSIGNTPIKNWRLSGSEAFPTAGKLDSRNMNKYKVSNYGCPGCSISCGAVIRQDKGAFAIPGEMHRPEYQSLAALGGLLMNDNLEAVIKANDICNRYGLDTIGIGGTLAMAMECYENGLITKRDTDGIVLSWGDAEAIVALVEKIANREGFGAVLADGSQRAAERIGGGAEKFDVAVRGKSLPYHDPRISPALGTASIADANPGHHMDSPITSRLLDGSSVGEDSALQADRRNPFAAYALGSAYHQLVNAAGLCSLYTVNATPPPVAELVAGASGWDFGWREAIEAGRRILTLRQAFNAREGLTPDRFEMPKRIAHPAGLDFEARRRGYFTEMGWDIVTGKPSPETLAHLGLSAMTTDL